MPPIDVLRPRDLPGALIAERDLADAYRAATASDPVHQARVVWWALGHDRNLEASTAERIGPIIAGFAARQRTLGRRQLADMTSDDATAFIWARTARGHDPAVATVHLRRTALRILVRTLARLGENLTDPTASLEVPPRTRGALRPLDDDEIGLVRIAAAGKTRCRLLAMATVALAEATATTGEIARLCWRDLELPHVSLPGTGSIRPRVGTLTSWGTTSIERFATLVTHSDPQLPIVYRGAAAPGSQPSQAGIVSRLSRLLLLAGLDADDLRPTSIRLWAPARALAQGERLEQAANQLGLHSLDVAAGLLGHRWQTR